MQINHQIPQEAKLRYVISCVYDDSVYWVCIYLTDYGLVEVIWSYSSLN